MYYYIMTEKMDPSTYTLLLLYVFLKVTIMIIP